MKLRLAILCSLAANLLLAATLWSVWHWPQPFVPPSRPLRGTSTTTESPPPVDPLGPTPPAPGTDRLASVRWQELTSTNFFTYRDNLRAVGCPEKTVRDILESEIAEYFAPRRRALADALQPRFWEAAAKQGKDSLESFEDPFEALRQQQRELREEVLAANQPDPATELASRQESFRERYDWVPAEMQTRLVNLEEQLWQQERTLQEAISLRGKQEWTPDDHAERGRLRAAHARAQKEILGDLAGEFELRNSSAAGWPRDVAGFEPTEAEWRAVAEAKANDKAEPDQAIEAALGPERWVEYQRANAGAYQQTRRVTRRFGLSDETAAQAWELQRAAEAAADQLRANPALDEARRRAALTEIAREASRSLRQALGDPGFGAYAEYAGDWLRALQPAD